MIIGVCRNEEKNALTVSDNEMDARAVEAVKAEHYRVKHASEQ